jgi:hypothetical protein
MPVSDIFLHITAPLKSREKERAKPARAASMSLIDMTNAATVQVNKVPV